MTLDDGTGGDWEVSSGLTKKQQKQKDRKDDEAKQKVAAGPLAVGQKKIPGMGAAVNVIPGMSAPKVGAKVADSTSKTGGITTVTEAKEAKEGETAPPKADAFTESVNVPLDKIAWVIGPKGSKIKMIQEKSGVTRIDTSGEVFTCTGTSEAVNLAATAIRDIIAKGYTALGIDDFSENYVMVHKNSLPDIIGKEGKYIRALKEKLHVEVTIPKTGPAAGKWKIGIAGKDKDVERAKEVINEIMMYYHSEVTHDDEKEQMVHEEIEVPAWAYSWIIGKGGCELRHIQNSYKVRMYIPREGVSMNQNVVVVGDKYGVPRASAHVQKLLYNAQEGAKGRDRQDKADDGWGDEGEEEDWMKQYMYKRH